MGGGVKDSVAFREFQIRKTKHQQRNGTLALDLVLMIQNTRHPAVPPGLAALRSEVSGVQLSPIRGPKRAAFIMTVFQLCVNNGTSALTLIPVFYHVFGGHGTIKRGVLKQRTDAAQRN